MNQQRLVSEPKNEHTCNQCFYFYRSYGEKGRSWGKCELDRATYDCRAKRPSCSMFKKKTGGKE